MAPTWRPSSERQERQDIQARLLHSSEVIQVSKEGEQLRIWSFLVVLCSMSRRLKETHAWHGHGLSAVLITRLRRIVICAGNCEPFIEVPLAGLTKENSLFATGRLGALPSKPLGFLPAKYR